MPDLGAITEIVNSAELTLEVGSDVYVALMNLQIHIGRTEQRDATTDLGPLYSYGKGDNFFTATLLLTGPELDGTSFTNATTAASFNELTQITANGVMNEIDWKIVAKDRAGNSKTLTATGVLRDYDVRKSPEGKVEIDLFVRITGDIIAIA